MGRPMILRSRRPEHWHGLLPLAAMCEALASEQGPVISVPEQFATTRGAVPRFRASPLRRTKLLSLSGGLGWCCEPAHADGLAATCAGAILCTRRANLTEHQRELRRRRMWAQARPWVSALVRRRHGRGCDLPVRPQFCVEPLDHSVAVVALYLLLTDEARHLFGLPSSALFVGPLHAGVEPPGLA